ncbi:hypothetical protein BS47DRAFT_1390219 [Hydnum rufescens UP504]|uniref:Uncharacterized protein n=1 Tax=Hydnum rufescens UP504 TaxID=1448309 RepID=A0A9P6DVY1_9AGAM|nr:hypothetical protein BS47DRAFT_1390219 [Hydnum rufescens UP504]
MDVKATQQLGDHFSREELEATLEKKGNNIAYHDLCVQLIVEHDCPSPWFITPTSYPGVPLGASMEDTVFNMLFSNGPTSPSSHMYTSLHQILSAGPFHSPSTLFITSGFTFTSAITLTFMHIITLITGFSSQFSSHLLTITTTGCISVGYASPLWPGCSQSSHPL